MVIGGEVGAVYLPANVDEMVVFNRLLSSSEIDQIRTGTFGAVFTGTGAIILPALTVNGVGQTVPVVGAGALVLPALAASGAGVALAPWGAPVDYPAWADNPNTTKVFLVETAAVRLADGVTVQLYLSNSPYQTAGKQFLPAVSGLPRLTRQANDTLSPNHIPTWGELTVLLEPDCRPDSECAFPWTELLSDAWNLRGQPLTIKLGDPGWAYADFRTIFQGGVGKYSWTDALLTLTLYDKAQDFSWKLPDYALPYSPRVSSDSWDQAVPVVFGLVKNYKPVLINTNFPGDLKWKFALAAHVIQSLDTLYRDNHVKTEYQFIQKDLFPPAKDGEGAAVMDVYGPYTGTLKRAEWLIQVDSVTAGTAVGLATFRWSMDNGVTWLGQGLPTTGLAVDPATFAKIVDSGGGALTLGGDYTGQTKLHDKLRISTGGGFGTAKFRLSEDNGATYGPEVAIPSGAPIDLGRGLSASFAATGRVGPVTPDIPSQMVMTIDASANTLTDSKDYSGTYSGGTMFWGAGGDPLADGIIVTLSGFAPEDWDGNFAFTVYPGFCVNDCWSWTFKASPIPLADGAAVQFLSKAEAAAQGVDAQFLLSDDDFALADQWRFILGSSFLMPVKPDTNITIDAHGLIVPALNAYTDVIGELIRAMLMLWRNWDAAADFDLDALAAFNAAFPYQAGLVVESPTAISDLIDQLLTGIPALYTINQAGKFYLVVRTPITTAPDDALELTDLEFLDLPEMADGSDNLYRRVYLHYDRNPNAVKDPTGDIEPARLEWLRKEFRQASARDENLWQTYPWAADLGPLDTVLVQRADAQAVAAQNLALYRVKHPPYTAKTKIQPFQMDLWNKLWVRHPRFGVGPVAFAIEGLDLDLTAAEASLSLWR